MIKSTNIVLYILVNNNINRYDGYNMELVLKTSNTANSVYLV